MAGDARSPCHSTMRKPELVTPGGMDVIDVAAVDPESRWLYYYASPENGTERYLYRSPIGVSGPAERLTPAAQAGTHGYDLSPDCRWAFHTWSTFDSPPVVDLVRGPGPAEAAPAREQREVAGERFLAPRSAGRVPEGKSKRWRDSGRMALAAAQL